jgi:hypothetical protein
MKFTFYVLIIILAGMITQSEAAACIVGRPHMDGK